jgi:peptidoglycan/xylan/chitin deacetylase (PgdA/CDA1 family)
MGLSDWQLPLRLASRRPVVKLVARFARSSAISQGPHGRAQAALTFDDGPHPEWTPLVLDMLERLQMRATFFVVGRSAAAYPELVVETKRRGHEVGTHLFSHGRGTVFDDASFDDELRASLALLEPLLGERLRWLRFPYGSQGRQRPDAIRQKYGLSAVHWTFSSHDSRLKRPADIAARVGAGLRAGAIVLMHDALADEAELAPPYVAGRASTVAALPHIAELFARRRLAAVTLAELLRP